MQKNCDGKLQMMLQKITSLFRQALVTGRTQKI